MKFVEAFHFRLLGCLFHGIEQAAEMAIRKVAYVAEPYSAHVRAWFGAPQRMAVTEGHEPLDVEIPSWSVVHGGREGEGLRQNVSNGLAPTRCTDISTYCASVGCTNFWKNVVSTA